MNFSGIDKALLQRAARLLEIQARSIELVKTDGGGWAGARDAKRAFDALMRDARDLRAVVKRFAAPAAPRKPKVVVVNPTTLIVPLPDVQACGEGDFGGTDPGVTFCG